MTNRLKIFSTFKLKGSIKFSKNAKQRVFSSTTKKAKNMRIYDVHAKQYFLTPNHF